MHDESREMNKIFAAGESPMKVKEDFRLIFSYLILLSLQSFLLIHTELSIITTSRSLAYSNNLPLLLIFLLFTQARSLPRYAVNNTNNSKIQRLNGSQYID